MKRTKKLLALALAMMMALSCMAMPAMAHGDEDEGIMPLYEESTCPKHGVMERVTSRESTRLVPANHGIGAHDHYQRIITYTYECGYTYISVLNDTCLG